MFTHYVNQVEIEGDRGFVNHPFLQLVAYL